LRALIAGVAVLLAARLALPTASSPSAWAEDPPKPAAPKPDAPKADLPKNPNPPGTANMVLPDEVLVADVLRSLSKITGKPILWSDGDKAVTTKKIMGSGITFSAPSDRVFDTLRAVLTFQEIILIPIGTKGYEVYVAMDARTLASQFILKNKPVYVDLTDAKADEIENQDGLFVATTIKVKNIDNLRDARTALQRIITQNNIGSVQEVPAARAFVVTDFAPNVVAIYRLLKQMDVQPEGKKVQQKYLSLNFALSEDILPILQDLFTGKQRISNVPQGQPGSPDIVDPEPRIISDPRTNQIIVYATADDIQEITALVEHLDTKLIYVNQVVFTIQLKNLLAEETAQVLTTLIDGTSLFGSSSGGSSLGGRSSSRSSSGSRNGGTANRTANVPNANPNITSNPQDQEKPAIVADKASNTLIIAASKDQFQRIKEVVEVIDQRKKQVLIEAALLELSLDDSFKFAVELGALDDNGLNSNGSASAFGGTTFGLTEFADRNGDGTFTDRLPPFVTAGGAAPTGLVGGIFAAGQVPLIYRALNTIKKTRVLQLPSVVTTDNEEATIKVLDEQATTDSTVTSGGNTSGGFKNFEPAGTTLSISPHIADANYLLLNINLEVSGFLGEPKTIGSTQIPADKFRRNIITSVSLPNRHTVVIGGLIGGTTRSEVDQVPFLGEIPILGNLFKGTNKRELQTNLFLFVTPTILRSDDRGFTDLDNLTCERKRKADELVGEIEIPFTNFRNCPSGGACAPDPATGCVRGSGSASDRLDRLGFLEQTEFRAVDRSRLAAERQARLRSMGAAGETPPVQPVNGGRGR
jgi:general secretion pathway protein D